VLGSSAAVDRIRFCDFNSVPHRFANIAEELAGDQ
jgi:hypothetical protein